MKGKTSNKCLNSQLQLLKSFSICKCIATGNNFFKKHKDYPDKLKLVNILSPKLKTTNEKIIIQSHCNVWIIFNPIFFLRTK